MSSDATRASGRLAAVRRRFLDLALRKAPVGSGSHPEFLRRRTAMYTWPDLSAVLGDLPWAVVGGVATRAYMPERHTQDLDVLIAAADSRRARGQLARAGFTKLSELAFGGATWRAPDGRWTVALIESPAPWVPEALALVERDPQGLPVLPLAYFVLMKWQAGRLRDLADAQQMLGLAADAPLEATRQVFARYEPDALADLESLIWLGKREMGTEG